MNLITEFRTVAEAVNPDGTFDHATKPEQVYVADRDKMPVIYVQEPLSFTTRITQSGRFRRWSVLMIFACLSDMASSSSDSDVKSVVDEMTAMADDFQIEIMKAVDSNGVKLFREISNVRFTHFYNEADANISGVVAQFEIEELLPYARC